MKVNDVHYLLPKIEELIPYTNKNGTFYDCGFNKDFNLLPFVKKLEIVNDIIRQSILVNPYPNPKTHVDELQGDCYTAAIASMEYLKSLNLGKNHRCVICRRRKYDPEDITSKHVALLLDDEQNETYFFDATPYVASKYGTVSKLDSVSGYYDEYIPLDYDKMQLVYFIKELRYKANNGMLNRQDMPFYLEVVHEAMNYQELNGLSSQAFAMLSSFAENSVEKAEFLRISGQLNPYSKYNENFAQNRARQEEMLNHQIKLWKIELNDLLLGDTNPKRQLELAQNIYQTMKMMNDGYLEKYLMFEGRKMRMTNMTPRFFYDHGLNVIMIKPSAYLLGVRATIRERFLKKGQGALFEYFTNLSDPMDITGITPMQFSHTLGNEKRYTRAMNGTSDIILLRGKAEDLLVQKKILRKELGSKIAFKEVTWFDGGKIKWEPWVTNLVHSTDNPSEASMHFMIGYPEQQVMTRFMYPNPKLEEYEKEK